MFRPFIEVLWFDAQKCACNSQVFIVLLDNKLLVCSSWLLTSTELVVSGTQSTMCSICH